MFEIKILGMGCSKCKKLTKLAEGAVSELGVGAEVVKVTDIDEIMNYGVMVTPALVIEGEVKAAGKIPGREEIKKWIEEMVK